MKKFYSFFRNVIISTFLFSSFSNVFAQYNLELVKDIRSPTGGSTPNNFTVYNGKLYFSAYDNTNGIELWVSNGTNEGTQLFMDIKSGTGSSQPKELTLMNDVIYFRATDIYANLWKTDGVNVSEIKVSDTYGLSPYYLTVYNNKLYFSGYDNVHGTELWVSDGTVTGTHIVKDINIRTDMGNGRTDDGSPSRFIVYNNLLYFCANDGVNGNELWVTDGTENGTQMVKDINSTALKTSSTIIYPTVFAGKLYFCANDGEHGAELWVTDGTESGTQMVKDIWSGTNSGSPNNLYVLNNKMYFGASNSGYEFWISDGTTEGTEMLKKISLFYYGDDKTHITSLGNNVFFRASDAYYGDELWTSDGTSEGTVMVKDIYPGSNGGCTFSYTVVYNNKLYFTGTDNTGYTELWVTDGTQSGTKKVTSGGAYGGFSNTTGFKEFDGSLYFAAALDENSVELWKLTTTTSVVIPTEELNFSVFPNPAVSFIQFANTINDNSYKIFNSEGKMVLEGEITFNKDRVIDVSGLQSGIYLLKTDNRNCKFIKQ